MAVILPLKKHSAICHFITFKHISINDRVDVISSVLDSFCMAGTVLRHEETGEGLNSLITVTVMHVDSADSKGLHSVMV